MAIWKKSLRNNETHLYGAYPKNECTAGLFFPLCSATCEWGRDLVDVQDGDKRCADCLEIEKRKEAKP